MTRFCPIVHSDLAAAVHSVDTLMATERERPDGVDASAEDLLEDAVEDLLADVSGTDARAVLPAAANVSGNVCANAVDSPCTPAAGTASATAVAAAIAPPSVSTPTAAGIDSYPSSENAAMAGISVVLSAWMPLLALVRLSAWAKNRIISGDRGTWDLSKLREKLSICVVQVIK